MSNSKENMVSNSLSQVPLLEKVFNEVVALSPNRYYEADHRAVAHAIKDGDATAIETAAESLRSILGSLDNVALVPVPSHFGYATYTLELAHAIGIGTIFDVLRSEEREPLYDLKLRGVEVTPDMLGFYAIGSIPEDMNIVFLDNVVATGTTARAAYRAFSRGFMLSYAMDL